MKKLSAIRVGAFAVAVLTPVALAASSGAAAPAAETSPSPEEAAQGSPGSGGEVPNREEITFKNLYVITGVRDSTEASTLIHCTNQDSGAWTVYVFHTDYDGTSVCSLSHTIDPANTATFATRVTAFFYEDETCSPNPESKQGRAVVAVAGTNPAPIICTAQVVDPANATPAYLTTLPVYRP